MAGSMLLMAGFYIMLLVQAQYALDDHLQSSSSLFSLPRLTPKSLRIRNPSKPYRFMGDLALEQEERARQKQQQAAADHPARFILFLPIQYGQGLGNIISGLLAAHLLGEEFHRIVCVSPEYSDFLELFEAVDEQVVRFCPSALEASRNITKTHHNSVRLITFEPAPNECALQTLLRDGPDILFMTANTYPRWPKIPQPHYFDKYYRAKPKLLASLPYNASQAPLTVVHLRQSDGAQDMRRGLDQESLQALGKLLPSDTYLVTNRVAWYDYFDTHFGWRHPQWTTVIHSALHKQWGSRDETKLQQQHNHDKDSFSNLVPATTVQEDDAEKRIQQLQMWVDWYTILQATTVYHTHSDFSISAIHWNDIRDTKTILGFDHDKQSLILVEESWRVDGETVPVVERTEFASGTSRLRLCGQRQSR